MTKDEALQSFFSGFGIPAYPEGSEPKNSKMPYLTYAASFDSWGYPVSIPVNLWYRTESEAIPNAKAQEIADHLPSFVPYTGGAILIDRGTPFSQSIVNESNASIKRRYINITAEYLSER